MKTTYLRSRTEKNNRDRRIRVILGILLLFFFFTLARPFFAGTFIRFIAAPVWFVEDKVAWMLEPILHPFVSRADLLLEVKNKDAQIENLESEIRSRRIALEALVEYRSLFKSSEGGVAATVLSRPPRSPYDTLVVSAGASAGVKLGDLVFTAPHVAVGVIDEVFETTSRVVLYSSAGRQTEGFMDNEVGSVLLKGEGGGSMEVELSRAFQIATDTTVTLPDRSTVIGIVDHVSGNDTDPFKRVLVALPINIQNLSWVELRHSE